MRTEIKIAIFSTTTTSQDTPLFAFEEPWSWTLFTNVFS